MRESDEDPQCLQALLDTSVAGAGQFLRESFEMPAHSLTARQLVRYFEGAKTVALATVTAKGEPRVAPIGAICYRGSFYIPTVAVAARTRHVRARPAVSLSHDGDGIAVIAHGTATVITPESADFPVLEEIQRASTGVSVRQWGEGVYLRIEPRAMYTYARKPGGYPG